MGDDKSKYSETEKIIYSPFVHSWHNLLIFAKRFHLNDAILPDAGLHLRSNIFASLD